MLDNNSRNWRSPNKARANYRSEMANPLRVGIEHQPGLTAAQLQHGALAVGQYDRPDANADRGARAAGPVDPCDVRGLKMLLTRPDR